MARGGNAPTTAGSAMPLHVSLRKSKSEAYPNREFQISSDNRGLFCEFEWEQPEVSNLSNL
jgi:hypothetical protein